MYRFMPSAQPVFNPLQGLIGLGAVTSYYRTPSYSCAQDGVIEYATWRCSTRSPTKEVNYKKGYLKTVKGTRENPYQVTVKDLYNNVFDSCRVKLLKPCSAPKPAQPVVVTTPSELVTLPVPTHSVPKPPPVVVDSPDDVTQLPIPPPYSAPVKPAQEATPVQITSLPPRDPLDTQMLEELSRKSKAGVVVKPPEVEEVVVAEEEEDSDAAKYLIGGILLLAVGGGMAYYFTRKKRK